MSYKKDLNLAEKTKDKAIALAVSENKKSNLEADEQIKQTLMRIKNLGLNHWNLDALIREIGAGQLIPEI